MKKTILALTLGFGLLFGLNPQTATKEELMKIKGVGEKKAEAIIEYRKKHKLKSLEDLIQVKGIGEVIAQNILKDVLNGDESSKPAKKKSIKSKKSDVKKDDNKSKKSKNEDSKKESKKENKNKDKSKKKESKKDKKAA